MKTAENKTQDKQGKSHPHAVLRQIERLEVGPVILEKDRISAPYRVTVNGKTDELYLIYKYEEAVFDPDDQNDLNMAGMIAAQVAFNYGLFCDEIRFRGIYDEDDQRFIRDMIENTAREIFVKKFLEPNPFLVGEVANLPTVQLKKYSQADLIFDTPGQSQKSYGWELWKTAENRYAILSSGGKDSLLSFGVMQEISDEVYPIFINESGRHWYTALNGYRYFKEHFTNTRRVWSNCDRLFNWMLRHFSFIRSDYASLRSDEYPIRLWTVSVFLFGAIPIIKKYNLGRLLIGDEFDTTVRSNFKGITHYNGLYDQSRYFDNALSRYYLRKGWSISQFSILRPLSEMLIEKILLNRYPSLQAVQTSCHAAHIKDGRVYPCGKCEKCRRIIGMITALGGDATRCGYTAEQIRDCLNEVTVHGVHQETAGYQQLLLMLEASRKIEPFGKNKKAFKAHPEILKLRFDSQRSPINSIPLDLREPIYRIFLQYADGAVKLVERQWVEFDLFQDTDFAKPYPFDAPGVTKEMMPKNKKATTAADQYLLGELNLKEAEVRFQETDVALLPVGAIEQHGPHLPLDTDSYDADFLAKQVAAACSFPRQLVFPLISYGVSYHHADFPGTISISNETLSKMVYEIGMEAARNGIKKLVIINGHGGNSPALNFAAQLINRDAHIFVCVDTGETSDVDIENLVDTPNDVHAGEFETSTSLAVRPHLVRKNLAKKMVPQFSSHYLNFSSKRGVSWYAYTKKISDDGTMGDPTKANAEKGKKIWKIMIAHLVAFIEDLKHLSLEEIYQRRY